jgi:hypothetical protein
VVRALAALALAVSTGIVASRTASAVVEEPPVFPTGLEMVEVTVTAHDEGGALVSDLRPEDFALREDGRVVDRSTSALASFDHRGAARSPISGC